MADTNKNKCAHPPCDCIPADGAKYCSAYCEGAEKTPEVTCECGHPGCAGATNQA